VIFHQPFINLETRSGDFGVKPEFLPATWAFFRPNNGKNAEQVQRGEIAANS
jgi:hypothetical protein